jgi:hypothetical protein
VSIVHECTACRARWDRGTRKPRTHVCRPADLLKAAAAVYRHRNLPGDEQIADWLTSEIGQVKDLATVDDSLSTCDEPGATRLALDVAQAVTEVSW